LSSEHSRQVTTPQTRALRSERKLLSPRFRGQHLRRSWRPSLSTDIVGRQFWRPTMLACLSRTGQCRLMFCRLLLFITLFHSIWVTILSMMID